MASVEVHSVAGEACKVTSRGAFTCIWTDAEGRQTSVAGRALLSAQNPHYNAGPGQRGLLYIYNEMPVWGWIEIELTYTQGPDGWNSYRMTSQETRFDEGTTT